MVFFEPMNPRIAPSSPELTKFYRERYNWRNAGEERMRFAVGQLRTARAKKSGRVTVL